MAAGITHRDSKGPGPGNGFLAEAVAALALRDGSPTWNGGNTPGYDLQVGKDRVQVKSVAVGSRTFKQRGRMYTVEAIGSKLSANARDLKHENAPTQFVFVALSGRLSKSEVAVSLSDDTLAVTSTSTIDLTAGGIRVFTADARTAIKVFVRPYTKKGTQYRSESNLWAPVSALTELNPATGLPL